MLVIALMLLAIPLGGIAQQRTPGFGESRIALVIGNASYKDAPLANPVHDARAIAKALNGLGFKVSLRVNLTQTQMRRAIREFGDALHAGQGVGLFYFAGHGVQISNRNFRIPVGSDIQHEYEVEEQAVDAGTVLSMMQSARARVNIVILDACRNNPFVRDFRSTVNGLAPMQAPAGTLIAFATAPGQTAIDGTGQLGLYTEHLVENLAVPGLKIEDVFKNVRIGVQRTSAGKQVPWENTSLTGDFYFRPPERIAVAAAAVVQPAVSAVSQGDLERAVLAVLARREQELAEARLARAEREAANEAIERLKKELAELRGAREADKAQAERAARKAAPQRAEPRQADVRAHAASAGPGISRARPVVNIGGSVERPDVRSGDRWTYQVTDGFTRARSTVVVEVAAVTENHIYTRSASSPLASVVPVSAGGPVDVWNRDWNQLRHGDAEYSPFYPSFQFPLEAGKQWSRSVQVPAAFGLMKQDLTVRVAAWERVTVPAGTFDAVKITLRGNFHVSEWSQLGAPPSGSLENTFWYAPAVRQVVKREVDQRDFAGSRFVDLSTQERWELVEYKPFSGQ